MNGEMSSHTEIALPSAEHGQQGSGVAVLDRAFALLGAFAPCDERLTLTELSRRTGLYKSTVLRLLAALEHGGFVRKLSDGQYAIGPQPLRLAAIYQRSFKVGDVIEPLLGELSQALGETASFYVRQANKRFVLSRVEPSRTVRVSIRVGEEFDIDQGASGKVLLAFTEPHDQQGREIRNRLWATSYGARDPETAAASVPVFGVAGEFVGALTISGPISRLAHSSVMFAAVATLLAAGKKATQALGGAGDQFDAGASKVSLAQIAAENETIGAQI